MTTKTIEIPQDLYDAIQKLKEVFKQMTGQTIEKDEDVIAILVWGFIDSLSQWMEKPEDEAATEAPTQE